ncbi:MAG: hypothetical protein IKL19_02555 [Paludibacteraceae bacterium]|nr:hypothetical protein [Paludibacteraceae bacterium]MBR6658943.1 hypothetical protein [Paludibacteraceae bacterium]
MKKLLYSFCLAITLHLNMYAQGAMVISDPASVAQRFVLATEEMTEQIEQKYKFIEQIDLARKALDQSRKLQQNIEIVSSFVKSAQEVVDIISVGENIVQNFKSMQNAIFKSDLLSNDEKFMCIAEMINCCDNINEISKKATAVVSDKNADKGVTLSDFERLQELRTLKREMEMTSDEMNDIYLRYLSPYVSTNREDFLFSFINF